MAVTVIDAPGAVDANSYLSVAEFRAYLETSYDVSEDPSVPEDDALVIMATRLMESMYSPSRRLIRPVNGDPYYLVRPTWTGAVATTVQRLLWPRTGMYSRTGQPLDPAVNPSDLKDATAELARQLKKGDRTSDNDVAVQGITAVRAGSVSVSFKGDGIDITKVIPDIIFMMIPPSWLTDELYESANMAQFDVVSE